MQTRTHRAFNEITKLNFLIDKIWVWNVVKVLQGGSCMWAGARGPRVMSLHPYPLLWVQKCQTNWIATGRVWVSPPPHGIPTTQPAFIEWQSTIHRTRMHSSRMRTAHTLPHWGVPPTENPLDRDPTGQRPPGQRPAGQRASPGQRPHVDRQTPVKT